MSVFDKFQTRDELLAAVEAALKQENENEWSLDTGAFTAEWTKKLDDMKSQYDREKNQHIKTRQTVSDSEKRIRELESALSEKETLIAELDKRPQDADYKKQASEYAKQIAVFKQQAEEAAKELPILREQVAKYQQAETNAKKRNAIQEIAKQLGIWESIIPDIEWRAPSYEFDDTGELVTVDTKEPVSVVLKNELEKRPDCWLPPSQGGSSNAGTTLKNDPAARQAAAEKLAKEGKMEEGLRLLNGT